MDCLGHAVIRALPLWPWRCRRCMLGAALSGYWREEDGRGAAVCPARACDRGAGWTVFIGIGTNDAHFSLLYIILYEVFNVHLSD